MNVRKFAGHVIAMLLLGVCLGAPGPAVAAQIDLTGLHALNINADDPAFAGPNFDDSGWGKIQVPSSLRAAGIDPRPEVFWYRIKFKVPADWSTPHPAIRLGIVERADEAYLNGTKIGGEGKVGPRLSDWHSYPPILPRLYPFDRSLLKTGAENVLAVRVAREPYIDDGGIIAGPVALVALEEALPAYLNLRQRFLAFGYLFLGAETLALLGALFALLLRQNQVSVRLFLLLYVPYYLGALERRGLLELTGLDHPALQHASNIIAALALPGLIAFVAYMFNHPVGRIGRTLQIASVVTLISVPFTGIGLLEWWVMESALVWHSIFLASLLLLLFWTVRAFWQGKSYSISLLVGMGTMALTFAADLILPASYVESNYGFRVGDIGVLVLLTSFGVIVAQNVVRTDRALRRANIDVQSAQELERARFARDIHDSVGQWLSAIKLRLEMYSADAESGRQPPAGEVRDLISDVTGAIEETRRVAHDLSPTFLEEHGLVAAMRSDADRLAKVKGMSVEVHAPDPIELTPYRRDHLYRVFQEALNNATAHGQASEIVVTFERDNRYAVWTLSDNGKGGNFVEGSGQANGTSGGLGLKTMQNRARLLQGTLEVRSTPGAGTSVQIRFPILESDG